MAQAAIQLDQNAFSCAICLDLLKDPATLPCGHNYCIRCVQNHWDGEEERHIYSCPQCRQAFVQRPALVKNTMLADIVEQMKKSLQADRVDLCPVGPGDVVCDVCSSRKRKAVRSCLQCVASYCETHLQPHYQSAALKKHQLVAPSDKFHDLICSDHNEVKKMFCRTDQQLLCVVCCMEKHKDHHTVSVAAERAQRQTELETRQDQVLHKIQDKETDGKKLKKEFLDLKHSTDQAVKWSEKHFTELIHLVIKGRSEVEQQIRTQQKTEEARIKNSWSKLQQDITELRRTQAQLEALALTTDHYQFLQNYPPLSSAETSTRIPTQPLGSFEQVTAAVSALTDLLQLTLTDGLDNISLTLTQEQPQPQAPLSQPQASTSRPQARLSRPEAPLSWPQALVSRPQVLVSWPQALVSGPQALVSRPRASLPQAQSPTPLFQATRYWPQDAETNTNLTTREDFLKYSQEITLDPNTVNKCLLLSEEYRRATYIRGNQSYPDHPDRFTYYWQVLSRERLTGRCYWEVELSGRRVSIALSYKNIERKGESDECEFGFNNKSWAFCCGNDGGNLFIFNSYQTKVSGPMSSRIGVYLDHSAGLLAFYSITQTMNLLHRVQTTFTQPLHAGIGFNLPYGEDTAHFPKVNESKFSNLRNRQYFRR